MRPSVGGIISEVSFKYGISKSDILSKSKKRHHVLPRQEAMFRAFMECEHFSLVQLGRLFERDHTSLRSGIMKECERRGLDYDVLMARRVIHRTDYAKEVVVWHGRRKWRENDFSALVGEYGRAFSLALEG